MKRWIACLTALALLALPLAGALAAAAPTDDAEWASLLIGSWHAGDSVGSGYAERIVCAEDTLLLLPSQYDEDDEMEPLCVPWAVIGGELVLYVEGEELAFPLAFAFETDLELRFDFSIYVGAMHLFRYSDEPDYFLDLDEYGFRVADGRIAGIGEGE